MPGLTALPITVAAGVVSTIKGQNHIISPRPCTFPLPTVTVSMNISTEHAYSWRYVAATRGVDAFQMRRGVDSRDERTRDGKSQNRNDGLDFFLSVARLRLGFGPSKGED